MLIHVIQNGNQVGPFSPAEFDDLLQKGSLSGDDLYWHEGCDGWCPVSLHPDFPQPVVLAAPPPPPPRLAGVRRVGQQASTLKVCRDCGHAVSPSATSCPNCGKRLKLGCLPKLAIGFGGLVIVYIILLILFPPRGLTAGPTVAPPKAEAAFIAKVESYVARYAAASNELQKTAVRSERARGLAQVVTDMQVSGWVGTLKKLETTRDGQASIAIQLDGTPIKVCTVPGLLGPDTSTLIEPNSPLYAQLSSMAVGQEVRFSGSFLPDEHDHIKETSLTEEGAMTEPEFVVRFSNVTVVQAGSSSVAPVPAPTTASSGSPLAALASPVPTVAPQRAQTAAAPLPEAETSFIDTVDSYISRYTAASNELQKSAVRTQRRAALARTITDMHVSGWIGTLKKLATSPDGDASISVQLEGSAISVHTDFRNPFDQGTNTLIEHSSALYNKLASLSVGDRVVFSGSFQPGETDHLHETSFTESGSMTAPEFVMRFSEVAPASATSSSGLNASSQSSVARVEAPQGETVPSPLPATSSSALETSPTPDSQVASLSDPKLPVAVSIKRTTATAEDDAPGDVLVSYKDGTSRLLTNGETSSQARLSPRTGTIGWVLNDPPTNRPGDGFVMSNPVRPRRTLVLYRDGKITATLQTKLMFIEHWGFEEDGTKVVFQCRESHGPGLFQRFDVETGRLLATASENDDPFPDWAASWTVPTPAGPTNEAGALRAALASPPSTSAALLNQVTHAQPGLVGGSAAPPSVDIQTGSLASGATPTTTSAPDVGVSERLLIGKWQGTRHLTEYRPDHTRVMDGVSTNPPRTWHLEGDRLSEMPGKNVYRVAALDQNHLVLEGDGGKRYAHQRVQSPAITGAASQTVSNQDFALAPSLTGPGPNPTPTASDRNAWAKGSWPIVLCKGNKIPYQLPLPSYWHRMTKPLDTNADVSWIGPKGIVLTAYSFDEDELDNFWEALEKSARITQIKGPSVKQKPTHEPNAILAYDTVTEVINGLQLQGVSIFRVSQKSDKLVALSVRTPPSGLPRNFVGALMWNLGASAGSLVRLANGGKIADWAHSAKNDPLITELSAVANGEKAEEPAATGSNGFFLLKSRAVAHPQNDSYAALPTKAQWKDKMARNFRYYPGTPVIGSAQQFQQVMGKPDRTQTVGEKQYWYYQCSDGTIQLVMNVLNLQMAGLIQADVNDY